MLHEEIFLATCNATTTNKKPFTLQRRCHTFATFSQLATRTITNKMADALSRRHLTKDELWLAHSDKIALQVAGRMLHASNLSRNVAKSRGSFCFSCNSQRNNCSCKMGCYTWIFFLQLATQGLLRCKLQEKLLRVTWPLRTVPTIVSAHTFCASRKSWFKRAGVDTDANNYATNESKIFLIWPNQI